MSSLKLELSPYKKVAKFRNFRRVIRGGLESPLRLCGGPWGVGDRRFKQRRSESHRVTGSLMSGALDTVTGRHTWRLTAMTVTVTVT